MFKPSTVNKIHELTLDGRFSIFFDHLGNRKDAQQNKELFDRLADIFVEELGLEDQDADKLRLLLVLGYVAGKYGEQDH